MVVPAEDCKHPTALLQHVHHLGRIADEIAVRNLARDFAVTRIPVIQKLVNENNHWF